METQILADVKHSGILF